MNSTESMMHISTMLRGIKLVKELSMVANRMRISCVKPPPEMAKRGLEKSK